MVLEWDMGGFKMNLNLKPQNFYSIKPFVYCSENIVHKSGDFTIIQNRLDFQSKNTISIELPVPQFNKGKEFWIHHFMKFKYFKNNSKKIGAPNNLNLSFVSPKMWSDPYESLFLLDENLKVPFYIRCACFAFDMQYCEEAMWLRSQQPNNNVFEDKTICVSFRFEKLIELLNNHAASFNNVNPQESLVFYISIVDYSLSKKSFTKSNVKNAKVAASTCIDNYINFLSLKRKAFFYENELRIFAVFNKKPSKLYYDVSFPFDDQLIRRILMPPLFPWGYDGDNYKENQDANNSLLKNELSKIGLNLCQSKLYMITK